MHIRSDSGTTGERPQPLKGTAASELGFNDYAREIVETRLVTGAEQTLRGRDVARLNLSPVELIERLARGTVVILRPAWWAELPRFLLLAITSVVAVLLTVMVPDSIIGIFPMFAFLPLAILANILHRRFNSKYVLSDTSITSVVGLFDWKCLRIRIDYTQLKAVELEKDIIERMLNVGTVRLSTAMFDQPEVTVKRLYNAQYYASVIKMKQKIAEAYLAGKPMPILDGMAVEDA